MIILIAYFYQCISVIQHLLSHGFFFFAEDFNYTYGSCSILVKLEPTTFVFYVS